MLRYAIRTEIRLITSELAIDLARFPGLEDWSSEDLNILASLFVNSMIVIASRQPWALRCQHSDLMLACEVAGEGGHHHTSAAAQWRIFVVAEKNAHLAVVVLKHVDWHEIWSKFCARIGET